MSVMIHPAVRALGLSLFLPVAVAQAQQQVCEVDEGRPNQVARATLAVQMATSAQDPAQAARQLTTAMRMLTDKGEQMANQTGRNYVLGKLLVLWSIQPNVPLVTTRGALGYATNPQGTVDIVAAIDSAFKVVETAHPECIDETARWRGQQAWVTLVNSAIERMNAEDLDSARKAAQRAIQLNPYAPYGYVVMANAAQKAGNATEAFQLYRQAVQAASRDTSFRDIRLQTLVYLGNLAADSAELAADAAARRPYVETARAAFEEILRDPNAGDMGGNARSGICRITVLTGDTAQLRQTYGALLASPANYSDRDLMNAGICMARAEMIPEATLLFRGAYEKNPYHRDALSNLSIMLLRRDDFDAALPLATRLEQVEPNSQENLQLLVLSYAGIAKRASDARRAGTRPQTTKAGARPGARMSTATADSLFRIEQAYTDSAVKANERKDALTHRVTLSDFSTSDEKAIIAGSVSNTGTTATPVTMTVDFVNRMGEVVQTQSQDLGTIAPGASARFSLTATPGTNIVAFRYRRIG